MARLENLLERPSLFREARTHTQGQRVTFINCFGNVYRSEVGAARYNAQSNRPDNAMPVGVQEGHESIYTERILLQYKEFILNNFGIRVTYPAGIRHFSPFHLLRANRVLSFVPPEEMPDWFNKIWIGNGFNPEFFPEDDIPPFRFANVPDPFGKGDLALIETGKSIIAIVDRLLYMDRPLYEKEHEGRRSITNGETFGPCWLPPENGPTSLYEP